MPGTGDKCAYEMVDKAIHVIASSGITYKVCPMETVMEGDYDEIMQIIKKAQEACFQGGVEMLVSNIKIEWHAHSDVSMNLKMKPYNNR